jgi:hypothetical protein
MGQDSKLSDLHKTSTGKPLGSDHLQDQEGDEMVILLLKQLTMIAYHQSTSYLESISASIFSLSSADAALYLLQGV